jgi:hypothetical protein
LNVIHCHACYIDYARIISQHFCLLFFTFMLVCAYAVVYAYCVSNK